jgi:hypothetical protein
MLSRLLKEHQNRQTALRDHTEKLRKQAIDSVNVTSVALLDSTNVGVANVFANQRKLERETQSLLAETTRFSKQTARWLSLLDNFNNSLKVKTNTQLLHFPFPLPLLAQSDQHLDLD